LKGYDYSQAGGYDITICVQGKECLFGRVKDSQMNLNDAGLMIQKWWLKLIEINNNIILDEHIVMPNHFHGVIIITEPVGADPRVRPITDQRIHSIYRDNQNIQSNKTISLPKLIQWFKTMSSNEYIRGVKEGRWPSYFKRLWQRNYYEHIIRDEDDLNRIRKYIVQNPIKWELDEYYRNQNGLCSPK
jgi:putative transposase